MHAAENGAACAGSGQAFALVDLPGYGFAQRSKAERKQWADLIEGFLQDRPQLAAVVLLVDARRGMEEDDHALVDFVTSAPGANSSNSTPSQVQRSPFWHGATGPPPTICSGVPLSTRSVVTPARMSSAAPAWSASPCDSSSRSSRRTPRREAAARGTWRRARAPRSPR